MTTPAWPQPYEGIYGVDRSDSWLLSLDPRAVAHRDALYTMGRLLRQVTFAGDQHPPVAALWGRMSHPAPGDLVFESSRPRRIPADRLKALGYLLSRRHEWSVTDKEWAAGAAVEVDRAHEDVWYIQYGPDPGDVARWAKADFTVLPLKVTSRWLEAETHRFLPAPPVPGPA